MAVIQNDRDVLLQAAPVRVVPIVDPRITDIENAVKGVEITAPSNVFQISAGGVASPSSIVMTAKLTLLSIAGPGASITWDTTAGTATLTGSGLTRTLTAANMASASVTIRARVQEGVGQPVYSAFWTIAKATDGTNGGVGADGERGSITAFGTLSNLVAYPGRSSGKARWAAGSASPSNAITADNAARDVIWQFLGNSGSAPSNAHMRLGDTVTLTNSGQTVSATGYWTGAAWDTPGTVIDGNLLVGGNVSGQEFTGGTFTGGKFRTSPSGDRVEIDSSTNSISVYKASTRIFYCNPSSGFTRITAVGGVSALEIRDGSSYGVDVASSGNASIFKTSGANNSGVIGQHNATGVGAGVQGYAGYNGTGVYGTSYSGIGVLGIGRDTGTGVYGTSSTGNAIYGKADGLGAGGVFESGTGPAIRLITRSTLPSDKAAGSLIYHTTHGLCYADGTNWKQITGTTVP